MRLTITPGQWSDDAAAWTAQAVDAVHVPAIRAQVDAGIAQLFTITAAGENVGCFVCRIDRFDSHSEGVIMVGAGSLPGVDLMASVLPVIEQKFIGCQSIRFHTGRAAVARRMARFGYLADEIICRKELTNGQIQQHRQHDEQHRCADSQ